MLVLAHVLCAWVPTRCTRTSCFAAAALMPNMLMQSLACRRQV